MSAIRTIVDWSSRIAHHRTRALRLLIIGGVLAFCAYLGFLPLPISPLVLAAGLGALLLGLLALRSMPAALTLLVATSPIADLSISTGTQSPLHFSLVWIGLCTVVWLLRTFLERRLRLAPSPANRPLLLFSGAALLSWLAGYAFWKPTVPRPTNALAVQAGQIAIFILSAAAFFLAGSHPLRPQTLKFWTGIVIALGLGAVLLDLAGIGRPAGVTGGLLMWPFVLLWALLLFVPDMPPWLRATGWLSLPLWGLWVWQVAFGWKSGWFPTLLGLGFLLLARSRTLFIVFLAVCLVVVIVNWEILAPLTYLPEEQGGSLLRPAIWYDVLRLAAHSPILGLGPANYMYYWRDPTFTSFSLERTNWWAWYSWGYAPPSHNMFVDIFAQTGLVGLGLFLWLIVALLRLGHRAGRDLPAGFAQAYARGVQAGFLALLASSFFFADWLLPFVYNITIKGFQHSLYSWLLLGSLVSLYTQLGKPA
ncbi:MAG: O-antigen ligase family protein [Chloroflexia bacterium]